MTTKIWLVHSLPQALAGVAPRARVRAPEGFNAPEDGALRMGNGETLWDRVEHLKGYFITQDAAVAAARDLAAKHPKTPFAIFTVDQVFETTEPKVIIKSFNNQNELVAVPAVGIP